MPIYKSKQLILLSSLLFFIMGFAINCLPLLMIVKCFIILAFAWWWLKSIKQYVLLQQPLSVVAIDCDDQQRWYLTLKNQQIVTWSLSKKSVTTPKWMFLYFDNMVAKTNQRVILAADSMSAKDWSILQLLVKCAKPLSTDHLPK